MFKRVSLRLLPFVSFLVLNQAHAMASGFYMGVALGPASNTASVRNYYTINYQVLCPQGVLCQAPPAGSPPTFTLIPDAKPKSTLFGSRLVMGYQFNDYVAIDGGVDYFSTIRYAANKNVTCSVPSSLPPGLPPGTGFSPNSNPCSPTSNMTASVRGVDLGLKLSMPLQYFDIYGKVGPMYMVTNIKGTFFQPQNVTSAFPSPGQPNPVGAPSQNNTYFKPFIAVGGDYTLTQNWVADLSWTHISVGKGINSIDFFALGFAYHFVNKFCGQFLCDD